MLIQPSIFVLHVLYTRTHVLYKFSSGKNIMALATKHLRLSKVLIRSVTLVITCTLSFVNTEDVPAGYGYCMPPWARSWDQPNIIIFNADDVGYGDLASYGHPSQEWNPVDDLAAQGMRFTNFYSAAATCSPSRAALFTGIKVEIA